jgi:hypothetical protein
MSMFNWNPPEGSRPQISPYMWVYWAISVPLTVLTLMIWRLWWKIEDARYNYQITRAKEGYEVRNPYCKLEKQDGRENDGILNSFKYLRGLVTDTWRGTSCFFHYLTRRGRGSLTDEENASRYPKKE